MMREDDANAAIDELLASLDGSEDWEFDAEERERQEVCQTCLGTRRYLARRCPDCTEYGDAERD